MPDGPYSSTPFALSLSKGSLHRLYFDKLSTNGIGKLKRKTAPNRSRFPKTYLRKPSFLIKAP